MYPTGVTRAVFRLLGPVLGGFDQRNRQETYIGDVPIPRSLAQLRIAAENGHFEVLLLLLLGPRQDRQDLERGQDSGASQEKLKKIRKFPKKSENMFEIKKKL